MTLAGVGLGKGTVEEMYRKVVRLDGGGKLVDDPRKWKKAQIRWRRAKVLIIDESRLCVPPPLFFPLLSFDL